MEKKLSALTKIAIVADAYPPQTTSAANQIRDLGIELKKNDMDVTVILPDHRLSDCYSRELDCGINVLRLKAKQTKDLGYFRRTLNEILMPFMMMRNFSFSKSPDVNFDGIIWYSPSIFHGFFVKYLKMRNYCKSYLVVRDIFPEWALDLGLMRRGLAFYFFKCVAEYQYRVADTIGIQTAGNFKYFQKHKKTEVLQNWLGPLNSSTFSIDLSGSKLRNRKIFIYAGNMGIAQNMDLLVQLAATFNENDNLGFLFIGRGSEFDRLKHHAQKHCADNTLFIDEMEAERLPHLFSQCHYGMLCLSPLHNSHNIPGKFISYLRSGLPCLAVINRGNDLGNFITQNKVGVYCDTDDLKHLVDKLNYLLSEKVDYNQLRQNSFDAFELHFSVKKIAAQILSGLS